MKKHIPNLLTLLNLLSGCLAVVFIFKMDLRYASLMIGISLLMDYLDGGAARLLNVKSDIGKELDSLADLVSFGLVPSLIGYKILSEAHFGWMMYIPFLMTLMSAYRLANFNLDKRQTVDFIGLPTPANGILWASLPLIINDNTDIFWQMVLSIFALDPNVIIVMSLVSSFLLVSPIRLFSLKFQNFSWSENRYRYLFLILSVIFIVSVHIYAVPFIILLYLVISMTKNQLEKKNEV